MAKVTLNVTLVERALLTEEEIKEQDRRWNLVHDLLKKNGNKINAKEFALTKEEKEEAIQDLLNR